MGPSSQSLSGLCHVLRLLAQALRDGRPVPWVLLELVSAATPAPLRADLTAAAGSTITTSQ
jgi:hypothetical protein